MERPDRKTSPAFFYVCKVKSENSQNGVKIEIVFRPYL